MGPHVINDVNGRYGTSHLFHAYNGMYTIYTQYCADKPSGYALGFINTIPRVYGIHTW